MKLKQIILIIAILLFASSCEKDAFFNKTKVEGIVTVKQTDDPIENITITVKKVLSPTYSETIAEFKTDENGYFYYEFRAEKDFEYEVLGKSDSCYSFQNLNNGIKKGKKNVHDFICWAQTKKTYHIVNKFPFDDNDKIEFLTGYYPIILTGNNIDDYILESNVHSYTYIYFKYLVTKNNQTIEYHDSAYIATFCSYDTITINY